MSRKPTVWVFSLEPIETRYTAQWHYHIPDLLEQHGIKGEQVDGIQKNSTPTPGAFLNFSDTNYWKSSQLCVFLNRLNDGEVGPDDHILFTDAWNPTVIQLKYMKDLLGYNWTLHGMWHAGSYDPQDFLGRLIGDEAWVRNAEKSMFEAFDHNYFATDFHIRLFAESFSTYPDRSFWSSLMQDHEKIVRTGWPMEYMEELLGSDESYPKDNLVLFPHRIAPEKQVEIFRDLAKYMPQYEFIVCQDQQLTKHQYHDLLKRAKIVFSANLQETLGISPYEGALCGAVPMVPDRLSYSEMYGGQFKYPSEWTSSWDNYLNHRSDVCQEIIRLMENYDALVPAVRDATRDLTKNFFSATALIDKLK